jgi:penicillin-binding protein-related factor A (putative recombinase)
MTQQIPFSEASVNKTINHEQLNQIIEAILAGKYSWACFLLLRHIGHDPLHYIPYRTYNRLVKENCQNSKSRNLSENDLNSNVRYSKLSCDRIPARQQANKIVDLDYIEVATKQNIPVKGGSADREQELNSRRLTSVLQKLRGIFR